MAAQRHEISLRVLKNISRVRPPFELFYDEFKVTKCCTKTFRLCWVLRSKIAVMRCVTFSNVLYVFGLFMNNKLGHVYISAWVWRFASVTEIIKYVAKLLLFACLVFSTTLCRTVYKFQASSFDELSFSHELKCCVSQVWRKSIFKFCVYKLVEAVRYLKFKWEFVIIGRGRLVLLKFKSSLCWRMLFFKAL